MYRRLASLLLSVAVAAALTGVVAQAVVAADAEPKSVLTPKATPQRLAEPSTPAPPPAAADPAAPAEQAAPAQEDTPVQKGGPIQRDVGCGPTVQYVEKTICVPEWVTETRRVTVTRYRQEQRTENVLVNVCVPVTTMVERQCVTYVPTYETRQCTYSVQVPEWTDEQRTVTVMVPYTEQRQGTRRVCKTVTETVMQTVTRDCGHWETQMVEVACAPVRCFKCCVRLRRCGARCGCCSCGGCGDPCPPATQTVCKQVWVPKLETVQVPVTVCRTQWVDEPCTYTVTACRPETRTVTVKVLHCRTEQRTRTYQVCQMKAETRTQTVPVTTYQTQQQTREVTRLVCIPEQVEQDVQVQVCRMVEKRVQLPVSTGCCVPACLRCPRVRCCRVIGGGGCGC
jgi:hypothetical protein